MINFILRWGVKALAIYLLPYIFPGQIVVRDFVTAVVAAAVLSLVNVVVKPLVTILTLPVTFLTLGLFTFVINALMLWLTTFFVSGFAVHGFLPALLGALVLAILTGIINSVLGTRK